MLITAWSPSTFWSSLACIYMALYATVECHRFWWPTHTIEVAPVSQSIAEQVHNQISGTSIKPLVRLAEC